MNKKINLFTCVVLIVLFSSVSFYFGLSYQKNKSTNIAFDRSKMAKDFPTNGEVGGGRNLNGGQTIGQILEISDQNMVVKLNDGGSKIIYFSDDVFVGSMQKLSKSDLQIGQEVLVLGSSDSSQNLIAESIQIR